MSIVGVDSVWEESRTQLKQKLDAGVISQENYRFSVALTESIQRLVTETELSAGDAVVLVSLSSSIMALAQGAVDLHNNKQSQLAKHYLVASLDVMSRIAKFAAEGARDDLRGTSAPTAEKTGLVEGFDLPPGGKLN